MRPITLLFLKIHSHHLLFVTVNVTLSLHSRRLITRCYWWQSIKAIQSFVILLPSYLWHRFHTIYIYIWNRRQESANLIGSHFLHSKTLCKSGSSMAIPQLLLSDLKAGGVRRLFSRVSYVVSKEWWRKVESLWELIWSWFMKR